MLTPTRRWGGLAAGLTAVAALRPGPVGLLVVLATSTLTAAGSASPDLERHGGWRAVDRLLADEKLGHVGPLGDCGLTHWWGLPAVAAVIYSVAAATGHAPSGLLRWLLVGAWAGWCSHLACDFVVGAHNPQERRGGGIPLAPWWWHVSLGFACGGVVEQALRWVVLPLVCAWQAARLVSWAP